VSKSIQFFREMVVSLSCEQHEILLFKITISLGLKRLCARASDVKALNKTISAEIHLLHDAVETVSSNMTSLSDKIPDIEDYKALVKL